MADILAQFEGYTLRPVTEADRPALEAWIAADKWHNGTLDADYFLGLARDNGGAMARDQRPTCCAMEDGKGILFFIRLSRAARVSIQFDTQEDGLSKRRTAMGLLKGMAFLEVILAKVGTEEWIFETGEQGLAEMARRRMGFEDSPDSMVRAIARPEKGV